MRKEKEFSHSHSKSAFVPEWDAVDWSSTSSRVFKIQRRIFKARRCRNFKRLHWLQRILIRSVSARLVAVRQVTTLNKEKRTPGFDRRLAQTSRQKLNLARNLCLDGKALPIRRVWIAKPGNTEKRPLGIPAIVDRAKQMLAKLALEPEWEAIFEPNSYGFRPGRSCHDAIEAILLDLHHDIPKYVFDADVAKCFDRIDHGALVRKMKTFPEMEAQISAWLGCGVVEDFAKERTKLKANEVIPTTSGTPQGGVISPLLANIALHGLETHLRDIARHLPVPAGVINRGPQARASSLGFVRYADDFILLHRDLNTLNLLIEETRKWLAEIGLNIAEEKSSVKDVRQGFLFLGFQIIMIRRRYGNRKYKVHIRPSTVNVKRVLDKVGGVIRKNKSGTSSFDLIMKIRPILVGWANYFRYSECMSIFHKMTHLVYQKLRAWVFRKEKRGNKLGRRALRYKYFPPEGTYDFNGIKRRANWVFVGTKKVGEGQTLRTFLPYLTWISSQKHVKVRGNDSPFNPNSGIYWNNRMIKYSPFSSGIRRLLQTQRGKCAFCGKTFSMVDSDNWEVDSEAPPRVRGARAPWGHVLPRSAGGKGSYDNLQLLHKSCHIEKSRRDRNPRCPK
jgi:RNA-directed DNA polymerase